MAQVARQLLFYEMSDEMLTYLIGQAVNGAPERRLAANFLLDCLRRRVDVGACLQNLQKESLLDIAEAARDLAGHVGLQTGLAA
jgi:hypothetical protein